MADPRNTLNPRGLNLHIYPSTLVGAGRVRKVAKSIHSTGCFSETHAVGMGGKDLPPQETVQGEVKLVRIGRSLGGSKLAKALAFALWQPSILFKYRDKKLDAVAAHNVWLLPFAFHLAKRAGAVFAYNAHELETESIASKGLKQRIAKAIERRYIRHVDVFSVVNESIADWYESEYDIPRPFAITNIPEDDGSSVDLRTLLSIPDDKLLYIHLGHLMAGRSIPVILESFAENPSVHVVFLGDGPYRSDIVAASSKHSNIHWLAPVAPESVVGYARGADVGLCLIEHLSLSGKLSTPNKFMEALAAEIPSLSSDLVEVRRYLGKRANDWILSSPEQQLGNALSRINRESIEEFKDELRQLPSWDEQMPPIIHAYRQAVEKSQSLA
ncbi:glycosyltransferase [Leucobacter denitrificans]|uniref:Glycosyltransferase n=1 Tax=Leucobacter denitrificans TaxID=683042 RepID=A0A7G9S3K8_9MICO|nr:glycosyltransferase [Leucobacter denitrificans]QNN62433.1 glycosyltransferase [Leucobacter denitrificans]